VGREKDVGRSNNNGGHSGDPLGAKAEDPQVLWEEYEYRHSSVWKVIVQITTAVVVLSVVPYVANETIVEHLQVWILAAPGLAFVLALFAVLVINNELDVLDKIRREHRKQHREILGICYDTDRCDDTDRALRDQVQRDRCEQLEAELEAEREANREHRRIIAVLTNRKAEIEAPASQGQPKVTGVFRRLVKDYLLVLRLLRRWKFRGFVNVYLLVLSVLSFVNGVICAILWVPYF